MTGTWWGQIGSFLIVGGFATGFQYVVMIALVTLGRIDAVLASTVGYIVSSALNYYLNKKYTFDSARPHAVAVASFILVALAGLGLNALAMWILVHTLQMHYVVAQLISTGCVLIWNFLANRYWTFRN